MYFDLLAFNKVTKPSRQERKFGSLVTVKGHVFGKKRNLTFSSTTGYDIPQFCCQKINFLNCMVANSLQKGHVLLFQWLIHQVFH